jgi:hypothetical protein
VNAASWLSVPIPIRSAHAENVGSNGSPCMPKNTPNRCQQTIHYTPGALDVDFTSGSFVVSDVLCRSGAVFEFSFPAIREELRPNQLCFY